MQKSLKKVLTFILAWCIIVNSYAKVRTHEPLAEILQQFYEFAEIKNL